MSERYYKISIQHSEGDKQNDLLIAFLAESGFDSFEEKQNGLDAYVAKSLFDKKILHEVIDSIEWQHPPIINFELLEDINWNSEWENSYPVVEFPIAGIRVRAPFHSPDPSFRDEIIIEPGMAFGTGHHETTGQILEVLGSMKLHGKTVADVGCGSGVLAIYAAKKEASSVFAFDNDEWAAKNAKLNFEHNDLNPADAVMANASALEGKKFDVFIANINRNIILADFHLYAPAVNQDGVVILSGFLVSDVEMILERAKQHGFKKQEQRSRNSWVVLILSRI